MWKWILGTLKPKHALDRRLGTSRTLGRFIEELPAEPGPALQAVAAVFDASPELGIAPAVRLQALAALDEFARRSCRVLSARLLGSAPKQVLCDSAWDALFDYYRALAGGYEFAVEALAAGGGDSGSHAQTTIAACRAMHAMAKCNMLMRMRYREAPGAWWPRIERLLAGSREPSQRNAMLSLYPDEPGETCLAYEYLVALLFEMAPNANLLPAQIHGIDLLLRQYASAYRTGDAFERAQMPFVLDPAGDAKPMRWLDGLPTQPGMRFFGLGEAYAHILSERAQAERARSVPEWLAPAQLSAERYRGMLDLLAAQWALAPPVRHQRRQPEAGEILIAHEFAQIRRLVGFGEMARTGRSLEYNRFSAYTINDVVRGHNDILLRAPTEPQAVSGEEALRNLETFEHALEPGTIEVWTLTDTSQDGLGAEAMGKGTWAKAGMLIAYRRPESAGWSLAVVRRLSRAAGDKLRIGLRKLPGIPHCARVAVNDPRQGSRKAASGPVLHYDAIKLAGDGACLLLLPGVFDPAWRYTLTIGQHWDFIRMQRCTECGLDFEQVAFTVVKAQQAA